MDQILPDVIPQGHQVFAPSLAPVPESRSTMMDVFDLLSSKVGSNTLIKSSSITVPVSMSGPIKNVFNYSLSLQTSSKMLVNGHSFPKPTDNNMQITSSQPSHCHCQACHHFLASRVHHNPPSQPHSQMLLIRSWHKSEDINRSLLPPLPSLMRSLCLGYCKL